MTFVSDWLTVFTVGMLAIVTPGPDFALTIRSSLVHSRKAGIYTAIGVGVGNTIHATYCLVGIGAVISQSILLFNLLKWIGAGYLIYLGVKSLSAKAVATSSRLDRPAKDISSWRAFRIGLFGNLLNPKATLFFLALFTQIVQRETPVTMQALYGLTVAVLSLIWFSLVATVISKRSLKARILSVSHWIERVTGGALIYLGLRLATAKAD